LRFTEWPIVFSIDMFTTSEAAFVITSGTLEDLLQLVADNIHREAIFDVYFIHFLLKKSIFLFVLLCFLS